MKIAKTVLHILFFISPFCFANEIDFGAAVSTENGICASFEKPVHVGSSVSVIETESPQYFVKGTLVKEIENCAPLQAANVKGPYFAISIAEKVKAPILGLVVYTGKEITNTENQVSVSSESEKRVYFRSCTSSEGVHMSAWLGKPITGEKLWHLYYYVGYDLEPSCEEIELTN